MITGQLHESVNKIEFVVQKSYEDGPWSDEASYPEGERYDNAASASEYATQVYTGQVQLNRHPGMKFRIIKRTTSIQEEEVTP